MKRNEQKRTGRATKRRVARPRDGEEKRVGRTRTTRVRTGSKRGGVDRSTNYRLRRHATPPHLTLDSEHAISLLSVVRVPE